MGSSFGAICNECGEKYMVSQGGGFCFHLLHCERCGKEKSIGFDELGEIHLSYLKELSGPYCIATREHDKEVQEGYPGEPLSEVEYDAKVEEIAGTCKCGGHFTFDALARCPRCKSDDYREYPEVCGVMYD